ncbi:kinase-interacting protein 1-like [Primulina huaijiensis]|uniref:kinase-interacting protein 1-like n=1 Tax=Primulina huaijiensis TaxID=1492673 RepID=UPI003CC727DB
MLQRAANNAYSWWWASHIRTKQSKWLDQSLQDMEEKVQNMLKLIEEDGDSFAKRAEMYYKRRPELITSVEEAYKAFRALADRYDLLSKELQNANHTIATVFPEQVQLAMDEDDESVSAKMTKNSQIPDIGNAPNAPKAPIKDLKGLITTASKQLQAKKLSKTKKVVQKSGLTKEDAVEEIDKLQKDILALQTVKEFARSSYESGLSKYWGTENQIMEMQQNICRLQDEFNVDTVIEDDDARTLMAEAALKSCQETLIQLQDKQEMSAIEAREESLKIEAAHERLESLKKEFLNDGTTEEKMNDNDKISNCEDESQSSTIDVVEVIQEMEGVEASFVKFQEELESLTVTEMAEKVDKLVNKVISLETVVSSQTVLISTLRTEADDLHSEIQRLEDEKVTLINSTHILTTRLKEMEEKLRKVQDLNKNLENQNRNLQTNFAEARNSLDNLSEKLSSIKPDEEQEETSSVQDEPALPNPGGGEKFLSNSKTEESVDVKEIDTTVEGTKSSGKCSTKKTVTFLDQKQKKQILVDHSDDLINAQAKEKKEKDEELNWQQMLLTGMEDREKILLKEYTTILRNYKDVKKKLGDMEKQERDSQFDIIVKMRELKDAIAKRDEEIHYLRQKLNLLPENKDIKVDSVPDERGVKPEAGGDDLEENLLINKEGDIKLVFIDRTSPISAVEEKLRTDIDAILDENLDFWLRFSTAFHQIQKFKTEVQDLQEEILKLQEKKMQVGSVTTEQKSEVRPIYKHLREIQTEVTVWLEQSASLKDEQKRRFASLCSIQEEITKALKEGVEGEEIRFSSHQAAKFQGEILNMKQENNKVRDELQAGLDHVSTLQLDIEKWLRKLNEEFGICSDQQQLKQAMSRSRIPLRSFIFGTKPKKQKHSILACMHPNRRFPLMRGSTHT